SYDDVNATKALIDYSKKQKSPLVSGHIFTTWSLNRDKWTLNNGGKHYSLPESPPIVEGLKLLLESGQ
ncbi:MAG: hypothetical protein ABGZ37_05785, partial [Akkermansiaceae bacterium]